MEDCGARRLKRQSYPRWQKVFSPARADFKSESQTENTKCRAGRGGISILRRTALTSRVKAACRSSSLPEALYWQVGKLWGPDCFA